jgi:uroporphyrinogen-III synthase
VRPLQDHPRLGLAREPGDALFRAAEEAGWIPVGLHATRAEATDAPNPCPSAVFAVVLSPAAARAVALPDVMPCLATGEATAELLRTPGRLVHVAESPDAEGLWKSLQALIPDGGDVLLVRGERSREFLEHVTEGSPWRLHPWITHREVEAVPFPDLSELDAVLALSPFQAELLAARTPDLRRFAWGHRSADAFARAGAPAHAWCEPRPGALKAMLEAALRPGA